jgi:cytochrome b subunit of formate dehydrogenase
MTARDRVSQIISVAGIEEMTAFERACFITVATSSMILVVAGMAFLLL